MNPDRIYEAALAFWSSGPPSNSCAFLAIVGWTLYLMANRSGERIALLVTAIIGSAGFLLALSAHAHPELFAWATLSLLT